MKNTRIAVPLSEEAYDAISKIAKVSKVSRGRIVADALEAAIPSFIAIADAYRMAESVEGEERKAVVEAMRAAETRLRDALGQGDLFDPKATPAPADARSGEAGGRASAGASEEADPPIANRGVHTPDKGGQE